jgi:hypothetical protein
MQDTAARKRERQEGKHSDYLFGNFLQLLAFRSTPRPRNPSGFLLIGLDPIVVSTAAIWITEAAIGYSCRVRSDRTDSRAPNQQAQVGKVSGRKFVCPF